MLTGLNELAISSQPVTDLQRQLHWEAGYLAAQAGDWAAALKHWQTASTLDEGPDRSLLYNLALAHQQVGQYQAAAERWRELLRRRPRKADHPDALTNEQVMRIWEVVADNYRRAEAYEEAIKTYRTAIKWAPDNIDLRLKYVEALQTEGRWQAAENELNRILERNPHHIRALTLLAESYSADFFPEQAIRLWQRILALEPQNPIARQQLAHLFMRQAGWMAQWGQHEEAIKIYQAGLERVPDSQPLRAAIGTAYAAMGKSKQAWQAFEQALAINPQDLQTLYVIYMTWLTEASKSNLTKVMARIRDLPGSTPIHFFFDLFDRAFEADNEAQAREVLTLIEARSPQEKEARLELALRYMDLDQDNQAIKLLRQLIQDYPTYLDAQMHLGGFYYAIGQTHLVKRQWSKAEAQARKVNDDEFLYQLQLFKDQVMHGTPLPGDLFEMLESMPPEMLERFLKETHVPPDLVELIRNMGFGKKKI
jgi:tetratricopeptide (TPR) repeat protein